MEHRLSDSSDSDSSSEHNILDFSRLNLDSRSIFETLEQYLTLEKKTAEYTDVLLLYQNQLENVPLNINRFHNLNVLNLSSNRLTEFPVILTECSSLTHLRMQNNLLKDEALPKSLISMENLKELNLSGNLFSVFPEQVLELTSLKYLFLGGNFITRISQDIWKLNSLLMLSLGGNQLTDIPATMGRLTHLQSLVLSDNRLESLPSSIANLKNLKSLQLHKNRLRTLPPEIVALRCLTELSLRENPLVVCFISSITHNAPSLLEFAARVIKLHGINYTPREVPVSLFDYLNSAHHCVNPKCRGVYFDNRVEHIKFVDFCGKYRIPLLQYLCSSKCVYGQSSNSSSDEEFEPDQRMMRKVLLG